jgi:hypothetical protein
VQRHGIGQQVQRSPSGSIPHDRVTIPQMGSSRSLALDRPRQSALRYPAVLSNRANIYRVRRQPAPIHAPLRSRTTSAIAPPTISHSARGTQIPITHAAPSDVSLPAVSSLGGLRTPAPPCAAPPSWGRHPKTFTKAVLRQLCRQVRSSLNIRHSAAAAACLFRAKSGSQKRMFTMGKRPAAMVIRANPPHKEPQSCDFELRVSGQEKHVQNEKRET